MLDVYFIGHGFMDAADEVRLAVPMHIYVKDNRMLDGRKIADVVTLGPSGYRITSADEEWKAIAPGRPIKEHYLCSDLASYNDINQTAKWRNKTARTVLPTGVLFTLPGGDYLFFTANSQAVRLSRIVDSLSVVLNGAPFQVHWTACRSVIQGNTDILKLAAINGGDLVNAASLT